MKKTYITPEVNSIKLKGQYLMDTSIPSNPTTDADENEGMQSKKYNGGLVWEEDE